MINGSQLNKICPSIKGERAIKIAALLDNICPKYGIDTAGIFHEFIANALEESWEFGHLAENLNYSAKRMTVVWPSRFPNIGLAKPYEYNPKALAEKVYGGRMGNVNKGDGYMFRGSGPMQLTGRDMFLLFTIFYNKTFGKNKSITEVAELLRTDLEIGIHSACWLFAIVKGLIPLAKQDNLKAIVYRINGGYTAMAERTAYYERAKRYIV